MPATEQQRDQREAEPSLLESPRKQKLIFSLLLVLSTLALYNPVTRAPFLNLDDDLYVTENAQVRSGLNWHSAIWAFQTTANTNWHPLTWLSHELDCQIFGINPAGPHMVNVLLHAASAALLFLMLAGATGMTWRSLMVAALFALHPMNVESVAWIAERKNVLSMLLFLFALAAYGWYARNPQPRRYLLVTLLYALALMAKPQVITFPFALLLLDYWPLRRDHSVSWKKLIWEKLPWLVLSAASAVITMRVQSPARHEELALWERLANAALSYGRYLEKTIWPINLAPLYPHPGRTISISAAALSAAGILIITVLVVIFRKRRYLFVGWFWFLGTLVPMIGLVQVGVQSMADRYAYIPLLGIFVILCWGIPDLLEIWSSSQIHAETKLASPPSYPQGSQASAAPRRGLRLLLVTASLIILSSLTFALHRQVDYWTDNFTLWRHTLDITRRNFIAEDNAATALLAQGRTDEAFQYFRRAQAISPADPVSALNVASYQQQHGNYQDAIEQYQRVFQLSSNPPLLALAHANSGYANLALKHYANAKRDFEAALSQQPENPAAYIGLGLLAQTAGEWSEAEQDFERAAAMQPTPMAYELLAQVLESAGNHEGAKGARTRAAQISAALSKTGSR